MHLDYQSKMALEALANTIDPEYRISTENVFNYCSSNYHNIMSIVQKHEFEMPKSDFSKMISFISKIDDDKVCDALYYIILRNHIYNANRSFQKYSKNQPLFVLYPELLTNTEYVSNNVLNNLDKIRQYSENGHRFWGIPYRNHILCLIDNSELYHCLLSLNPTEIKVHVDPYRYYDNNLHAFCTKGIVRWLDPHWKSRKLLYSGQTGGIYDPSYPVENLISDDAYNYLMRAKIWDSGSVRLEVSVKNNKKNGCTILLEELYYIFKDGILTGRCIHMDIIEDGIDSNSIMNHIDFAINYYLNSKETKRLTSSITNNEEFVEASFRTHVVRLNKIKFESFPRLCISFIKNKRLSMEFLYDLLGIMPSEFYHL